MNIADLMNDPRVQIAGAMLLASASSTVHTYLDKHPRLQASAKLLAHFVGPLNLPAMKAAGVAFCRAVVAYEDAPKAAGVTTGRTQSTEPNKANDGVKAWPQS